MLADVFLAYQDFIKGNYMTPENFCYWLQGYFEINGGKGETNKYELTRSQVNMIQEHLKLVFHKVTPNPPIGTLLQQNSKGEWSPFREINCFASC